METRFCQRTGKKSDPSEGSAAAAQVALDQGGVDRLGENAVDSVASDLFARGSERAVRTKGAQQGGVRPLLSGTRLAGTAGIVIHENLLGFVMP